MRVLIACEFSGTVRDAFMARGHDAMSCDLLPTEKPGPHYQGDVRDVLNGCWDLMIAHPPCTDLSVSGARHFAEKRMDGRQQKSISFFMSLAKADVPMIAIENPVCIMSSLYRKPDQIIQPWQFGHGETKATCLWLKGLPLLRPTQIVEGRENRIHRMPPSADRGKLRAQHTMASRTLWRNSGGIMTDLPCCKLCKAPVETSQGLNRLIVGCSSEQCILHNALLTDKEWLKLMYVPDKKTGEPFGEIGYADGWNDCADAMQKGGDL